MVHDCFALDDGHECGYRDAKIECEASAVAIEETVVGRCSTDGVNGTPTSLYITYGSGTDVSAVKPGMTMHLIPADGEDAIEVGELVATVASVSTVSGSTQVTTDGNIKVRSTGAGISTVVDSLSGCAWYAVYYDGTGFKSTVSMCSGSIAD